MTKTLEKRVAELEARLALIEKSNKLTKVGNEWLDQWTGLFQDDPDFEDALRLGRAYRKRQPKC